MSIRIGDFVTCYEAGYWQLMDIIPKIAHDDYSGRNMKWKKGDHIGQWVILKKAFTQKMKPRIDFSYQDASYLKPVSPGILTQIEKYFSENPDYKEKFEKSEIKLRPIITNCWINLSDHEIDDFRALILKLPEQFTMNTFWDRAQTYKDHISAPPTTHLINFLTYPWSMDEKFDFIYFGCELITL